MIPNPHNERESWEELKKGLYELDEIEFAGSRDKMFAEIDHLFSSSQAEVVREMMEFADSDSYAESGFSAKHIRQEFIETYAKNKGINLKDKLTN